MPWLSALSFFYHSLTRDARMEGFFSRHNNWMQSVHAFTTDAAQGKVVEPPMNMWCDASAMARLRILILAQDD